MKPLVIFLGCTIPYRVLRLSWTKQHVYPERKCLTLYGGVEHCRGLESYLETQLHHEAIETRKRLLGYWDVISFHLLSFC